MESLSYLGSRSEERILAGGRGGAFGGLVDDASVRNGRLKVRNGELYKAQEG